MKKLSHGLITATLFFGGIALGTQTDYLKSDSSPGSTGELSQLVSTRPLASASQDFGELSKRLSPSVVHISVRKSSHTPFMAPGGGQGSGVIISNEGEILTNNHVVEGASSVKVKLSDGTEYEAELIGADSQTDLALLKLKEAKDLPKAALGDSEKLGVGDWVMAIGNPFGLESTVTVGVLSGKGRVIGAGPYDDFLQTDASINPGNSGGPLFNTKGEVVGINTAIIRGGQGIGFSIPINLAKKIASDLRTEGVVKRGYLGIGVQALSGKLRKGLGLDPDVKGALVASVEPGGPAHRAGLEPGDIIHSISGLDIEDDRDLLAEVADLEVGQTVDVELTRDGQEKKVKVDLAERPVPEREVSHNPQAPDRKLRLGVALTSSPLGKGVLIQDVFPATPASESGLLAGDLVFEIGGKEVDEPQQFLDLLAQTPKNEVALLVSRDGKTRFVVVEER